MTLKYKLAVAYSRLSSDFIVLKFFAHSIHRIRRILVYEIKLRFFVEVFFREIYIRILRSVQSRDEFR